MTQRVMITGVTGWLGGGLAQRLALEPGIERLVGSDFAPPRERPQRIEFVPLPTEPAPLGAILEAARIDTVVHARPPQPTETDTLLAALEAPISPPSRLVFCSSADYYGYDPAAPAFLGEDVPPARSGGAVQAEAAAWRFAARHPSTTVTILRFAEPVGAHCSGAHMTLLGLPAIPSILGFDPRWQLVDEHDAVSALLHAVKRPLPGVYNVAADGILALSEIGSLLGKPVIPLLPPFGVRAWFRAIARVGLPAPVELVDALRLGRGLDNRRLKATGFAYRYTAREGVLRLREHQQQPSLLTMQGSLQDR